jgi:hypothetical protein
MRGTTYSISSAGEFVGFTGNWTMALPENAAGTVTTLTGNWTMASGTPASEPPFPQYLVEVLVEQAYRNAIAAYLKRQRERTRFGIARAVSPSRAIACPGEPIPPDEVTAACQEAVSFAQRLASGKVEMPPADLLALARQVVQQQQMRQEEDVEAWAEQLARDVGHATD